MNKVTPFLWFNDNAEAAAEFYLALFPHAKKVSEMRSSGVGPWEKGKLALVVIELEGQQITMMNGGPAFSLTPAISFSVQCGSQQEIDHYWDTILAAGGRPMQCGWITDQFGLCWQIVPENVGALVKGPKGMAAMMQMVKFDLAKLQAAASEDAS